MDINIRLPIMDHVLGRCHFTRQHDTESGHSKSHRADKVRGKSTFMATRRMDARNRYCTKSQQKQEGKMKGNKQRTTNTQTNRVTSQQCIRIKKRNKKRYMCAGLQGEKAARVRDWRAESLIRKAIAN